jgi:hypothetical protein
VPDILPPDRRTFEAARRAAATRIPAGVPELAVWMFGYLRAITSRDLRCEALHGVMAAVDDDEAIDR